jgi:hypothetical protein
LTVIDGLGKIGHRRRSISEEAAMKVLDPATQQIGGVFSHETIERYIADRSSCWAMRASTCSCPSSLTASPASG